MIAQTYPQGQIPFIVSKIPIYQDFPGQSEAVFDLTSLQPEDSY